MTDALADIRKTEQTIRQTEAEVQQERAELRRKVDTAAADDRRAYAEALAAGAAVPKPTSATIKDRIRDIEQRILPGCDESLWLLADDVVLEIEPDVDPQVLRKNMHRWQPPDPGHKDRPSPTHHMEYRPTDIVDWVLGKIAAVERSEAKRADESERAARKREAERRVNAAQAAYNAEQQRLLDEADARKTPAQQMHARVTRQRAPWRDFDRHAFLEREGLLEDYDYVQPGALIQVQGGNEQRVEQVPRSEMPTGTNATEA
jgi:hypothetical protein